MALPHWNRERVLARDELLPSPWDRYIARLIDQILVSVVAGAILVPSLVFEFGVGVVVGLVVLGLGLSVYEVVCTALWGRTLGKRLKHLRVADVDDGGLPGWSQSTLRWLVLHVAFWAEWSVLLNRTHRGPHDRAAHTVVVYSE